MAEVAASQLLGKLALFLNEEVKHLGGVEEHARYIRDELQRMTAFLAVSESVEDTDAQLKVWAQQIREVAYDTEDVLDKFKLRLQWHQRGGFFGFLIKGFGYVKTLKARYQIASEMQIIRSRLSEIAKGHQRYSLNFYFSKQGSSSTTVNSNIACYDPRGDALFLEEAELVGIQKPKEVLIEWLVTGDSGLKSVVVVGMGGSGKTTLVKKVYDDASVNKHFASHAWLTVSESCEVELLLKDMIQQLYGEIMQPAPSGVETMNINGLKGILKQFLHKERYIIVLDDVWNINVYEAIKHALPNTHCGSRVILTTRSTGIASSCCSATRGNMYSLNALSPEESWILFCKKTFHGNSCPPHLEEISRKVLKRCEGLPLAIVAISGVLATKDQDKIEDWEMIYRSLGEELNRDRKLESIKKVLLLSYNDLPYHLKICFLYMSIFPEKYHIKVRILKQHWIAESLVNATEGKTLEEVADSYINELISRSLVQVPERFPDGRPVFCRIHDMLRVILVSKSRVQNMVTIVHGCNTSWPERVHRLSIHSNLENVKYRKCLSQLRSLVVFKTVNSLSMSSWLGGLLRYGSRLLKVLDFEGVPLEVIPNEIFKLLHLIYLNLSKTKVKKIPKLIGKLKNLETLYLDDTAVTELPIEILKLQKLRQLSVARGFQARYFLYNGFKAPNKIGSLQFLQTLRAIEANPTSYDGVSLVKELGRLTKLRNLGIVKLRGWDGKTLCSSIEKLTDLRTLDVSASEEENEILDLDSLSLPPRFLKRMVLGGRLLKLPHWIASAHSLVRFHLCGSKLREDPLQFLENLPNLVELTLERAYEGERLNFKACGFQRLRYLTIEELKGLRRLKMEEGTMPHLEVLDIRNCVLVEELPFGIEHLSKLQRLMLGNMSRLSISNLKKGGDYWKVAKIPGVYILVGENGRWRRKLIDSYAGSETCPLSSLESSYPSELTKGDIS